MVRFNRRGRLDTSRIRDRRGGGGLAIGGIGGVILVIVALVAGVDPSVLFEATGGSGGSGDPPPGGGLVACDSTADIESNPDCRFVAFENSVQAFWDAEFAARGASYTPATFTVFRGGVATGCGSASSAVGPFYCPPDRGVYMDLQFFELLQQRLGAQGGDFAEAYVVAHEFGHHVQNLTGQMDRVESRQGADSDAVRLELQADCLAGVWAANATTPGPDGSPPLIVEITEADIAEAIDAAETVGDDYIQERSQGSVTPETWTHGSSEQRRRWFTTGLTTGDLASCDTFAATQL